MKRFFACVLSLLIFVAGTRGAGVIPRSFDELVARADIVFKGTVTALTPQWVGEGDARHIVTYVTFAVDETYKGDAAATQTLRFMGGTVGAVTMTVPDTPRFAVGQKVVLFVTGNGRQFCPLVGIHQGRFHVDKDEAGRERVTTNDGSPVVNTAEIGRFDADGTPVLHRHALAGERGMTSDEFKAEIVGKVAVQASGTPGRSTQVQP